MLVSLKASNGMIENTYHVVRNTRQHTRLEYTQDKSDTANAPDIMHERRANGRNAEAQ